MKRWGMVAVGVAVLTGCGSQSSAGVPQSLGVSRTSGAVTMPQIRPDRRGVVKVFNDTFGDAVPTGIVAGPDGALWFTDSGNEVVGRITTRGKYTLQMPAGAVVSDGITVGPDGNLWFTGYQSTAEVARITTGGKLTLFPDGGGSFPQGITAGPDGALWIAESNGTVGRMTTQGSVTHFAVAPSNAELEGIVTGPDGNLWVTQFVVGGSRLSNQVIRVTTSGQHTTFTVGSGPKFICVGPDKALWFAEESANAVGRITTQGAFTEFPTGAKYAAPSGIAAGPDGALWFTDFQGGNGIGRITTSGKVKFYKVQGSVPELFEIAAGPDKRMWFTSDLGPAAIGRITTH